MLITALHTAEVFANLTMREDAFEEEGSLRNVGLVYERQVADVLKLFKTMVQIKRTAIVNSKFLNSARKL